MRVLNACRAWRFAAESTWSSKAGAAAWGRARLENPELVAEALAARFTDQELDRGRVEAFLGRTARFVEAEAETARRLSHS